MAGSTVVSERERVTAQHLVALSEGLGRVLDFARAVEIARLLDEEDDEELPR